MNPWTKCSDKLPPIDQSKPSYFIFINPTTYQSVFAYNEFIERWPPLLLQPLNLWYWQEVSPRFPDETQPQEDEGKEAVNQLLRKYKTYHDNIKWHIERNQPYEPDGMKQRVKDYAEVVKDLESLYNLYKSEKNG